MSLNTEFEPGVPDPQAHPGERQELSISYAFQPIVNVKTRQTIAYEALIRGNNGEPAAQVLASVPQSGLHCFDIESRSLAVAQAMKLALPCDLNLNFLPGSLLVSSLAPLESTLEAAAQSGLAAERIVVEITEGELIHDVDRFAELLKPYRAHGLKFAIDDFGAGYSGLNLLAAFQPDQLKLDMALVRGVSSHGPRQAIVRAIASVCLDLGIDLVAEGVETLDEFHWLHHAGIDNFQGYLFAKPGFQALPQAQFPA